MKHREALAVRLAEKKLEVDQLSVRAPRSGMIIRRGLDALSGAYLDVGDEIAAIGDEHSKELRISISQDDMDAFTDRVGESLEVAVPGYAPVRTTFARVIPRASRQPTHPALAAVNGGPLPVNNVSAKDEAAAGDSYELLAPRFTGLAPLSGRESTRFRAGQRGVVFYRPCRESIGGHVLRRLSRWVRDRFQASMRNT
jgi:hypothetical protein